MNLKVPARLACGAAAVTLTCVLPLRAAAEDASPWIKDSYSSVRLIAGSRSGNVLLGGIGFQLEPGWKTYWRTPGDSGVPPRISFAKSDNIDSVTILWPTPSKFPDGAGGISFGYKKHVLLPLRIVAKSSDKPVILRAEISYAVCDRICIPAEATAELAFTSVASTEDSTIAAALETVPKPARIGEATPVAIKSVRREGKTVLVDVAADDKTSPGKDVELFAEGPTPDWALPVPKLIKHDAGGLQHFSFDLDGLPPGAKADGAVLKLTVAGPGAAYEVAAPLD